MKKLTLKKLGLNSFTTSLHGKGLNGGDQTLNSLQTDCFTCPKGWPEETNEC